MNLLLSSALHTTIGKALPRGALFFVGICALFVLAGWPNTLHAAPRTAPFAQVGCSASMTVGNTAELNNAIGCYNGQTTAGVYNIFFNADITLDTASTVISNSTTGVALDIYGNDKALSGAATYRGLEIAPNTHVTIRQLTIREGKADPDGGGILNQGALLLYSSSVLTNSATNGGGGIYNAGTLTVSNGTFSSNSATNGGGGIYNAGTLTVSISFVLTNSTTSDGGGIYSTGTLTVSNCTLSGNSATNGGGGIYNAGTGTLDMIRSTLSGNSAQFGGGIENNTTGTLTVSNSTLSSNSATNGGGGIYNTGTGTLSLELSTLSGNSAQFGGGTYNTGSGTLTVIDSTLSGNSASNSGGSIYNVGRLTVRSSRLSGNSAQVDGGSIYNEGTLTVSNSTLSDNTAQSVGGSIRNEGTLTVSASSLLSNTAQLVGGGIYHSSNGTLTVSNSTLSNNKVTGNSSDGGGIYSNGPLAMTNSTLSGNSANDIGGGIYNNSALTLRNTIIANSPKGGDCFNNTGTIADQTYNLIEDAANSCGIANGANGSIIGQDPVLAALDYGDFFGFGPRIHALLAASPAIDKGDAVTCAAPPINNLDQIGVSRPQGATCDIGAVEYVPPSVVCAFPATVSTTADLNNAIGCYNSQTTAGVYTIDFNADITLDTASTVVNNTNPGVALQINGHSRVLSGANTYRGLEISANTQVTIVGLTIRDGKTATHNGGGIYNNGILTVSSSTLSSNSAQSLGGGILNNGTLTVTNSLLSNNSTVAGGGIYNAADSILTVSNSTFNGNLANNGGGIRNDGVLSVSDSTFSGNGGRGLYNTSNGILTVTNSTLSDNDGGIYNDSTLTMSNSTLSGNSTTGSGGGLYNTGTLTVTNSTLSDNSANNGGGGLYLFHGTATLKNTIIANSPEGGGCVNTGGTITQTHNLIEDAANSCGIANGANGSIIGQDAMLASLIDNDIFGFSPQIHPLFAFSPAIDKGDAATCAAAPINNRDQTGQSRPQGAACDIGAVEYTPTPVVCNFPATVSTTSELNYALSCYNIQPTAGVYTITFNADITLDTGSTVINNPNPGVALQINGNGKVLRGAYTYRALEISANTHVTIDNLKIFSGKTDSSGGGILNKGTLTLHSSLLASNQAPNGDGGGIYNTGTGKITISLSTISGNSALFRGGGIYNEGTLTGEATFNENSAETGGGIMNNGSLTVDQGTFSKNTATKDGGGIYNNLNSTLTVSNTSVITNSVNNDGGGIYNAGQMTVSNSRLNGNSVTGSTSDGGGIYNTSSGTLNMTDSTVRGNAASSLGGGIANSGRLTISHSSLFTNSVTAANDGSGGGIANSGTLNMLDSTLSGNSAAGNGGGIDNNGPLTASNSTLSGNSAVGSGGGIDNNGPLTVINSTLSGNSSAGKGGGINLLGALTIKNTIIANSPKGGDCVMGSATITQTNNLIESVGANACGIANGANNSIIGQDPVLAPLTPSGGSDPQTHVLLAASPAIDKGDAATCAAAPINNRDQRGVIRPLGAACDIGAVEFIPLNKRTLTLNKAGSGSGTVKSNAGGIDCGATCVAVYDQGATVTLTATLASGSTFAGWSGACSSTAATCTVTLDSTKTVTATFNKVNVTSQTLTVSKAGAGAGKVASSPAGIDCGATCNFAFAQGAAVALTATPDAGSTFAGWNGACTGTGTCQVTMDTAKSVTATFNKVNVTSQTLTVSKAGTGTGKVTSSPAGIDCGTTCSVAFTQGATVTLTATPDAGSTFAGWSGACSGTASCQVTIDTAKSVEATFTKINVTNQTLTVSKAGSGTGKVTSSPVGIDCGTTCSFAFTQGAAVTLTAAPDAGSTFAGWGGACSGTASCQVTMDSVKAVTATFTSLPTSQGQNVYLPIIKR